MCVGHPLPGRRQYSWPGRGMKGHCSCHTLGTTLPLTHTLRTLSRTHQRTGLVGTLNTINDGGGVKVPSSHYTQQDINRTRVTDDGTGRPWVTQFLTHTDGHSITNKLPQHFTQRTCFTTVLTMNSTLYTYVSVSPSLHRHQSIITINLYVSGVTGSVLLPPPGWYHYHQSPPTVASHSAESPR